jgi:hypothetical protein
VSALCAPWPWRKPTRASRCIHVCCLASLRVVGALARSSAPMRAAPQICDLFHGFGAFWLRSHALALLLLLRFFCARAPRRVRSFARVRSFCFRRCASLRSVALGARLCARCAPLRIVRLFSLRCACLLY